MAMIMQQPQEKDTLLYRQTKKRVKDIRSFYINLACYCVVIPTLIFINLYYVPEFLWFYISMLGWGVGLLFHGMSAFRWNPFFGDDWEDRKMRQFIKEEEMKQKAKDKSYGK